MHSLNNSGWVTGGLFSLQMHSLLRLDPDQFEPLLRVVSEWIPNSMVVYHWLKIASTGMAPLLEGASCFVDQWPSPTRVCCADPVIYEGLPRSYFLSFAVRDDKDEHGFLKFLQHLDVALGLSTTDTHAICGLSLPAETANAYCSYFRRNKCSVKYYENDAFWVPPEFHTSLARSSVNLPQDYYFDTLRLDEAAFVDETWPHRWIGSLPLNVRKIRYMPNVCIRRRDDQVLASFEIMHSEFGLINHLYTKPQFRRLGLAKAVELRQMQNALEAEMIPYKLVVCEKEAPVKMTEQMGFWQKYGQYPFVEVLTPEGTRLLESNDTGDTSGSGECSE